MLTNLKKTMIFGAMVLLIALVACSSGNSGETTAPSAQSEVDAIPTEALEDAEDINQTVEEASEEGVNQEQSEPQEDVSSFDIYGGASEDDVFTTGSGLQYVIFEKGSGAQPETGQVVSVHYTGWLEDGTEFDSSIGGTPFQFAIGQGQVISGWDEGLALLQVGGKARLIIPSELAYGDSGAGGLIPPGATLIFDVELLDILPGSPDSPTAVDESDYTVTDSGLKYYDLQPGEGQSPDEGNLVIFHYTLWLQDGTKLGTSIDRGQPIPYVLGSGDLVPGFEEGLATMQVGGIRQLVIPPELGYGETGAGGGQIPPNATLIFEVEVLEVQ